MSLLRALVAMAFVATACSGATIDEDDLAKSVFRVRGEGCQAANIGTAFAIEPNVLLTNAHVVAGVTEELSVTDAAGDSSPAVIVLFDPINDLALLQVDGLTATPLALGPPVQGDAVLADARIEGELNLIDVEVTHLVDIESGDIYDDGTYLRKGMEVAGDIGPGSSGAPLILGDVVVGAAFAETRDGGVVFATSSNEIELFLEGSTSVLDLPAGRCRR